MTFPKLLIATILVSLPAIPPAQAAPQRGEVVFQTGFDEANGLRRWEGAGQPDVRLEPGPPGSPLEWCSP